MSTKQRWTHAALPFLAALSITAGASAISSMQAVSAGRAELLTGGVGEQEARADVPGWKPRQRALDIERGAHQSVWITFVPESEDP
jgi:hypothetical protein